MDPTSRRARDLACRLLSQALARCGDQDPQVQVLEKMDAVLSRLSGAAISRALLSRSVGLANTDVSWLRDLQIPMEGSLRVLDAPFAAVDPAERKDGVEAVVAHWIGLLHAFIGERLTLQLMKEAWPDLDLNGEDARKG